MKKIINDIKTFAALLMAGAAFTACSSDDNITGEQPAALSQQTYTMTVNATKGDDAATRALSLSGKTLNVKWAATDEVSVFPESMGTDPMGTLTAAASETGSTTLTGDLTSAPSVGDKLNLLFPRATWNYTGQTGVLLSDANSIEKKYDYALAEVEVAEVNGNTITTTGDANFASQQAIVKFILKNKSDNSSLDASSLTISAASNKLLKGMGNYTKSTTHSGYTFDNGSSGYDAPSGLVDGSTGSKWCVGEEHKSDGIWYCEFHTASAVQVDGYTLTTGNDNSDYKGRNPKDWVLKAKVNSGDAWTTIATVANESTMEDINYEPYDFIVDNPGTYQYFRIEISSARDGGTMQLSELQLWEGSYSAAYGDLTVTPASATSEMTVALRNENAGSDTYTLTANVGGKNYTYEKSGVTFQNGKYYEITVKMAPAANAVTWTASDMSGLYVPLNGVFTLNNTIKGITVTAAEGGEGQWYGTSFQGESGTLTFTSSVGNIKSIVISAENVGCSDSPTGWTVNYYDNPATLSWSGTPSNTVDLPIGSDLNVHNISSIVFTLE